MNRIMGSLSQKATISQGEADAKPAPFFNLLRRLIVVLALLTAPPLAASQVLPELLLPVDAATVERLAGPTAYDMRKRLYFAKRYRIVKINMDLLDQEGAIFTITPFEDAPSMKVKTKEVASGRSFDNQRHWRGEIMDLVPAEYRAAYEADPERKARLDFLSSLDLWVRRGSWHVHPELEEELARSANAPPLISIEAPNQGRGASADTSGPRMVARTVSGRWLSPTFRAMVVLMVIEEDPRYHVLYVEDPEKRPEGPNFTERRRRYSEFVGQIEAERRQHQDRDR